MTADLDLLALADANVVQPKPQPAELDFELGVSSFMPFSTFFQTDVQGKLVAGNLVARIDEISIRQLVDMRHKDGQARALYRLITLPIRAALQNCSFIPDESGDDEAEFIEQMLTLPAVAGGMTVTFNRAVSQMLMGLFDGFAPFEMVYHVPDTGPLKGKWTLKKLAYRPAETVWFLADNHGNFEGFRQVTTYQGRAIDVVIDAANAFYYAANEEEQPFYGQSFFTAAFYHYDKKVKLYYLGHLAAQHHAVGARVGTVPANANPKEKAAFQKALADFGVAMAMLVPFGYTVTELNGTKGAIFPFMDFINHHNSQMSKSVLATFFDQTQGGDVSMIDFGSDNAGLFMLMLQTIMSEIADKINNDLIPKFIDWNFGTAKYPKFRWGAFTDEQKGAIRDTFDKLAVAPTVNVTPQFMFEIEKKLAEEMGLEIDYDDVEQQMQEQQDQQQARDAEMQKAQVAALQNPPTPPEQPVQPGSEEGQTSKAKPGQPVTKPTKIAATNLLSLTDLASAVLEEYREELSDDQLARLGLAHVGASDS